MIHTQPFRCKWSQFCLNSCHLYVHSFAINDCSLPTDGNVSFFTKGVKAHLQSLLVCSMRLSQLHVRVEEMILRRQTQKGEEGWERRWEDDRVADWSKGFLSPPAMPSVHARLSPLVFEHTTHNALCLWFLQLHHVSGVHLFCIKVRGKGTMGKWLVPH